MDAKEIIRSALESIKINKLRSSLTALGVIIGVASIILLISISAGIQNFISKEFEKLGTNSLFIIPGKLEGAFGGGPPRTINKLTFQIVDRLERSKNPAIVDISSFIEIATTARYKNQSKVTTTAGVEESYFVHSQIKTTQGRLFTEKENEIAKRVAVIGPDLAASLYRQDNPIGKKITISNQSFEVIGILETRGNVGGVNVDNQAIIPLNSAKKLTGANLVNSILVRTTSTETLPQAKNHIEKILDR